MTLRPRHREILPICRAPATVRYATRASPGTTRHKARCGGPPSTQYTIPLVHARLRSDCAAYATRQCRPSGTPVSVALPEVYATSVIVSKEGPCAEAPGSAVSCTHSLAEAVEI
ncbi:hypothetical protein MRX96_046411 [Rhipicephalus microplus]